ncbi:EAL domain-containing protein [Agarivorans sp. TSD2052]|uniref:ABC transporter substrate binding protein n=1 Tax=Agarivorans sp. TSD2052 TaxID=2937286 RepID=UPI00200C6490|nr:ABC transporter substrate binding protein [Agarivorans sp. TSD2052]UPW18541.1 EAL domain-containing protein [Agarivorans sp. TSD2052]
MSKSSKKTTPLLGYIKHLMGLFVVLTLLVTGQAQARTARVLLLNSYQAGLQWDASFDLGLRQEVGEHSVWFYNHRVESTPRNDDSYASAQIDLLNEVVLHYQFDLIVALGQQALDIATSLQDAGVLRAPIVAAGADLTAYMEPRERHITGVHQHLALRENLLLIRQLSPELESIHLLVDSSSNGKRIASEFAQLAKQFALTYTVWHNQDYEEIKAKTSILNPNDAILFGVLQQSLASNIALSEQQIASLSEVSRAPIYSLWQHAIGHGAVGGFVTLPEQLGKATGSMVLQVLQGTDVRDIAISAREPQTYLFDYAQLERWKIPLSNLDENASFLNQRIFQSWQQRYQVVLALVIVALAAMLLIIWGFRSKRKVVEQLDEKNAYLSSLFDFTDQACGLLDENGHVLVLNQASRALLGDRADYLVGNSLLDSAIWQHQPELKQQIRNGIAECLTGERVKFQAELQQESQSCLYDISISPQLNDRKQVKKVLIELRDLSLLQQRQRQLSQSELHYRMLFDQSPAMLMLVNRLGVIVCCNHLLAKHLGFAREHLDLSQLRNLYSDSEQKLSIMEYLNSQSVAKATREIAYQTRQGKQLWFKESMVKIEDEDVFMVVCEDVTATINLARELDFHANFDLLTGIYNRGYFERRLNLLLQQGQASSGEHALLFIDLAQFKVINDTFGHGSGDQALKQVANVLELLIPESAIVARLGSDEFAILLEHTQQQASLEFANVVIDKLNDTHYVRDDRMFSFGCSIGVTLFSQQEGSAQQVMAQADNACFTAKSLGRSSVYLYQTNDQALLERQGQMEWVTRIQKALREERFLLYAQAIVPVTAGDSDYLHYEVLLRMIDEDGRIVPPGAFLPAAENYNLADQIDRVVIAKSLQWLAENPGHLTRLNMCSMNLSGQSLGNAEFVEWLLTTLENSALPLSKLCFETTETVAIANLNVATEFFNKVRQLGCKIALDDFGSGLSSFGYLKNLPIDYLKIDGIFIRDLENDHMDAAIVRSINQMAHVMGKKTIAEFVENDAINQILLDIGVDYAQGYHFGKPVPIEMLVLN